MQFLAIAKLAIGSFFNWDYDIRAIHRGLTDPHHLVEDEKVRSRLRDTAAYFSMTAEQIDTSCEFIESMSLTGIDQWIETFDAIHNGYGPHSHVLINHLMFGLLWSSSGSKDFDASKWEQHVDWMWNLVMTYGTDEELKTGMCEKLFKADLECENRNLIDILSVSELIDVWGYKDVYRLLDLSPSRYLIYLLQKNALCAKSKQQVWIDVWYEAAIELSYLESSVGERVHSAMNALSELARAPNHISATDIPKRIDEVMNRVRLWELGAITLRRAVDSLLDRDSLAEAWMTLGDEARREWHESVNIVNSRISLNEIDTVAYTPLINHLTEEILLREPPHNRSILTGHYVMV